MNKPGVPKKGAVARLRELYKQTREETLAKIQERKEQEKKEQPEQPAKKIAKGSHDLESL